MEFRRKFRERMELELISLGLLLLLSAVNADISTCGQLNFLAHESMCHVFSPDYPKRYRSPKHYTWQIQSPHIIKVHCRIDIPQTDNCTKDNIVFQFPGNNTHKYCGRGTFNFEGINPTITFDSPRSSKGGEFVCQIRAEKPFDENNCDCGWKYEDPKIDYRIVNGTETGIHEYPMMAALYDNINKEIYCGATIISNEYVLTAAHCIDRHISRIDVLVGEHDISTEEETGITTLYRTKKCVIHPHYRRYQNDLAVCKIAGNIEYFYEIGPACLPFQHKWDSFAGSIVTALGWGFNEYEGNASTTLQEVDLNVVSPKNCKDFYPDKITLDNICTFTAGKDSCQADSGGPVLWKNPTTKNLVLVGVTSYGTFCASHKPSVNMRIGAYLNWIQSVTPDAQYCKVE